MVKTAALDNLSDSLNGELFYDQLHKTIYATDASVYREIPLAVAYPKNEKDLKTLVNFAIRNKTSLIPRAAGTSLAGQCVGQGIVVDVSKYLNKIIEFNEKERWVRVEPGVIRDDLNRYLKKYNLHFGPNTSTANRCMIGGMVGNNSCGSSSIVYGSTREHTLSLRMVLSDGSVVTCKAMTQNDFAEKLKENTLESKVYKFLNEKLGDKDIAEEINAEFPKLEIHRRNTGYALDKLLDSNIFDSTKPDFNLSKLICGSEGTLGLISEVQLNLEPLPPKNNAIVAFHFDSVRKSMLATQIAMTHHPYACELMDKTILDCTKNSTGFSDLRFFVEDDPEAILLVELRHDNVSKLDAEIKGLIDAVNQQKLNFANPIIRSEKCEDVWKLRKAGLGLLANIPGDAKAVACIEDTAVDLKDLPDYIDEFDLLMTGFDQKAVYYAHAGAGELHLRPILNLKESSDVQMFYDISLASAKLVKKYGGSLSGEHGDGRVRAGFIPLMVGEKNYELFRQLKKCFDPNAIFNPGKIVDAPSMTESLRYVPDQETLEFDTKLAFPSSEGMLRMAEKCNGSGDCRKPPEAGGVMCPSYHATRKEKDTTRARANILREFMSQGEESRPFESTEVREVLDLCLSCKACLSECPSNVDMASLKAESLHQYYKTNKIDFRSKLFSNINKYNKLASIFPRISNYLLNNSILSKPIKKFLKISVHRSFPAYEKKSFADWFSSYLNSSEKNSNERKVYFFNDEFTNFHESRIGQKAVMLLDKLGYEVLLMDHEESGRAAISKGDLDRAQKLAIKNVKIFGDSNDSEIPIVGIEPSAILSFKDEYPRLVRKDLIEKAQSLAERVFLLDEFLFDEFSKGNINSDQFDEENRKIFVHTHCHQKALSSPDKTAFLLSIPKNHEVNHINSGCCGMAGSFGFEEEHYDISMKIGEISLFPQVRSAKEHFISANGVSCRQQIFDGTGQKVFHPIELLYDSLK